METIKVDLEKIAKEIEWNEAHADYLIISREALVIIEETSRAKPEDIRKLDNTIKSILNHRLNNYINLRNIPEKIIAVIHAKKRIDRMVYTIMLSRMKKNRIYISASCNQNLKAKLRKYKVKL